MKVIGVGLPRTGTTSLAAALETLGFGPVYHLGELMQNPGHLGDDLKVTLEDYAAAVDYPACYYWTNLVLMYPDARVILTVRDPEQWYESACQTIYSRTKDVDRDHSVAWAIKRDLWLDEFQGRFEDREFSVKRFMDRSKEIQANVESSRLLMLNVVDGWPPLCRFLEVPVPEDPFPHLNRRDEF